MLAPIPPLVSSTDAERATMVKGMPRDSVDRRFEELVKGYAAFYAQDERRGTLYALGIAIGIVLLIILTLWVESSPKRTARHDIGSERFVVQFATLLPSFGQDLIHHSKDVG